jgi:hypothetical protein
MELALYQDVLARIRAHNPELVINVTTGPGGRFVPSADEPSVAAPGTTLMQPERRVEHIAILKPDICTLDLNTMNSGAEVVINTPANVRRMAKVIAEAGVKPEIEFFDSGDIALLQDLLKDGTLKGPALTSFVMGVHYGFQPSPETVTPAASCRQTQPSPPSASAAIPCRPSHCPTLLAVTCGSASRMPSTSAKASSRQPMPHSSPKRAGSSRTSAARSRARAKRAHCSA